MFQAGAEPHDVSRVPEIPGRPPLIVQWGDPAADEVGPNYLESEPGRGEVMDPGGGDRELLVIGIEVALVLAADRRTPANPAELPWILLRDPAPPALPLLPPLLLGTLRVRAPALGPRDPSNTAGDGAP